MSSPISLYRSRTPSRSGTPPQGGINVHPEGGKMEWRGEKTIDTQSTASGSSIGVKSFSASTILDEEEIQLPAFAPTNPQFWAEEVLVALQSRRSFHGWADEVLADETIPDWMQLPNFGCKKHHLCQMNLCIPKEATSTDTKLVPSEEHPRCRVCQILEGHHEREMREVIKRRQDMLRDPVQLKEWEVWLPIQESLVERTPEPDRLSATEVKAFKILRSMRLEAEQLVADAAAAAAKTTTTTTTRTTTTTTDRQTSAIPVSRDKFQRIIFRLGMGPGISMATLRRMYRKWCEPVTHGRIRRQSLEGRFVSNDSDEASRPQTDSSLNEKLSVLTAERIILITTKLLEVWNVKHDEHDDEDASKKLKQFSGVETEKTVPRRPTAQKQPSIDRGRETVQLGRLTNIRRSRCLNEQTSPEKRAKQAWAKIRAAERLKMLLTKHEDTSGVSRETVLGGSLLRNTMLDKVLLRDKKEEVDLRRTVNSYESSQSGKAKEKMALFADEVEDPTKVSPRSVRRTGITSKSPRMEDQLAGGKIVDEIHMVGTVAVAVKSIEKHRKASKSIEKHHIS